ncbi:MAG: hypothetical protein DMG60_16810 [Acidobacteria bacterium]|nr:MAG: hypothetical protein DMG60_16810 [Acidobacteriota bacterium]
MSSSALGSSSSVRVFSAFIVFLLLILAAPLMADSHARIVRLSYVDGDVELDKGDGRGFNTAYMNMPISHGWKLWARDGQAEAEFEDGSSIRLTPDTLIVFSDLSLDSTGGRNTSVELQQGTAYFDIRHRDQDGFHLVAGRDRIELSKTVHFRLSDDKHQVELAVLSGEVQVSNGSATEVAVRKGETIRLDDDDPGRYYLAKSVDVENYDTWDSERVKNHDEAVSSTALTGTNNSLVYGLSDLSSYGDYFFVPGYGNMWRPASVPLAWDPFADGYWLSYPGSGYVFVSSYPWGWAPYRYGSWQFVNGRGWCWAPGNHWNSWHTVPPVHNRPPNFHHPEVPHQGPPVIAVNNGIPTPVPHRAVLDNDAFEHRWPHSVKETNATGQILRQGQSQATLPASSFGSGSSGAPATVVGTFPMSTGGGRERVNQMPPAQSRTDALRDERMQRDQRNLDLVRARQASSQTTPAVPSPSLGRQTPLSSPATASHSEIHATSPAMNPRMESHNTPTRSPAMHMESRPMGPSPSMGSSRSSSPSFSGGSMSHGSTGGGGHSSGNHR